MEILREIDPQELETVDPGRSEEVLTEGEIQADCATGIGDGSGLPAEPLVAEIRYRTEHPYTIS